MNEFKNRSKTGRIPPGKQQKVIRGTFTDKNVSTPSPSSARKNVRTPVASSLKPNQDLEKMRADLNTISDRLDDVENKLPVLNTKILSQDKSIKHSDKTSKGNISARSVHSVYNAQDFFEENQVKIKSSTRLSNEVYEEQPLKMEIPKTEQKRKNLVINIQRELKEWKQSRSKTRSVQTELTTEDIIKDTGYDQEEALNRVSPSSAAVNEPSVPTPRPPEDHLNKKDESSKEPTFKYPLDQFLPQHFRDEDESELKNGGVKDWLTKVNMDEEVPRDLPVEMSLPPPRHVLNQSAEYQVIEKAAQLLKKVEQHWKKSLFQNRLQLSPISESLNSSESENYIERLAAIKFRDAAYKKPTFCGTDAVNRNAAMNSREQNFLMSYDVVSNYFDIMGTKKSNANDSRDRNDENQPAKCPRCLAKTGQKKSVSVLENQQFVLKQNTYGRRSNLSRQSRGGSNVQISPRSNDSLQSNRTYASAYSSPRIKSNLFGERARMSTSNPDLRTINKECTHVQKFQNSTRCYCCGNKSDRLKYKATLNKSESSVNADNLAINTANNVSVINVKSSNQDGPSIPEVNPRKLSIAQDKMIIIQHLPQVDIRPELSKQTGPVICIEAEQQTEEIKESKNNNIGVFNYIHKNKSKVQHYREFKPFSNYSKYRSLTENPNCSEEEFFAAQLELRSVAENFIFRLKKNDNPSGYILMSTLLRLMDEVSELIDTHLNGTGFAPTDSNLPPRMEMVSDLLSDELKTWGAQHPQHYQRLNNIIQHLILDIQFIKNGNIDTLNAKLNERPSSSHYDKAHKKSSILKTTKRAEFSGDHSGRHRYASTSDSNFDRDRSDLTYRSRNSEEISLSDKLLHENALKVLRLEKAYKINHKARTLKWKEEERNSKENLPKIEITAQYSSTTDEGNKDNSADDSGRQQSLLSSDNSTPVVAIISPNESIEEHHDKTISDRSVSEDDKSIAEDIEDEKESDSIPEEQDEDDRSRLKEDQQSQDHQSDKQPESEGEEEVQEVISDSSQAVDKHKDSGGSDYDEDFEPELTEQPSQSVTATSSHHNENMGKSSQSHHSANDDLFKNDKGLFKSSKIDQVNTDKNNFALSLSKTSNQTLPKNINPINIQKVDKISKIKPLEECSSSDSYADFKRYREQKKDEYKMSSKFNDDKKFNSTDHNNFVKVHVRDKKGEIILSYAGAKVDQDNKAEISSPKKVIKERCDQETITEILKPASNIDNYIEAERKVLENLTSNILKGLLDDKIKTILSQFMKDDVKIDEPSTSKFVHHFNKQQSTQTSPEKIIEKSRKSPEESESENEYILKSPTVKLNVDSSLRRSDDKKIFQSSNLRKELITSSHKEIERNELKLIKMDGMNSGDARASDIQQENDDRFSPDLKLLISMVSDLDSSDAEYCEASLNLLKDDEFKEKTQVDNQNLRLHHFNSDEFLVYPHLNPHPSNIKCLQYSQDDTETKMDQETLGGDSIKSEDVVPYNKNISSSSQIAKMKSVAIDCKLNGDKETLNPIIESIQNFNNCSTQTEIKTVSKPYTVETSSLVDFIELSCSLSSSSSDKLQTIKKESSDSLNKLKIDFPVRSEESKAQGDSKSKQTPELLPQFTIEKFPVNINTSEVSSDIPNDIDPLNIFTNEKNDEFETSRDYTVIPPLNDISSITDTTEHSSPSESLESRSTVDGSMLRVLQTSVSRQAAWSSSTDSTTDDERLYFMNQPPSDDDVLNDLEQLMDYLKNSKSSASNVRIRHCSRHKKM